MVNSSRVITDAQQGIHKNLLTVAQKHLDQPFRKPVSKHTQEAFDKLNRQIGQQLKDRPLILDSCCGTAMSTRILAEEHSEALVVGVDRSASRLGKEYNADLPNNAYIVQAECGDFWRLARSAGWSLLKHTLFYPNPYPKAKHLKRRWHAHPAFPALLALGGEIEIRSNWDIYVKEFCSVLHYVNQPTEGLTQVKTFEPEKPMTLFEKKYAQAGQPLYSCKFRL